MLKLVRLEGKFRCRFKYTLALPELGSFCRLLRGRLTAASSSSAPILAGLYLQGNYKQTAKPVR